MGSVSPPAPPPLPRGVPRSPAPGSVSSRAREAARASWMAPLIVIIVNYAIKNAGLSASTARALVIGLVSLLLYLAGLVFAIYALSQVRIVGRAGVLAPAIVGLILNGLFLLLVGGVAVSSYLGARSRASQRQSLIRPLPASPSSVAVA